MAEAPLIPRRRVGALTAALAIALLVPTGCGEPLSPAQQAEYDRLRVRHDQAMAKIQAAQREEARAWERASDAEQRAGARTSGVVVCGNGRDGNLQLGPLPFKSKKGYRVRLSKKGNTSFGRAPCAAHDARVGK